MAHVHGASKERRGAAETTPCLDVFQWRRYERIQIVPELSARRNKTIQFPVSIFSLQFRGGKKKKRKHEDASWHLRKITHRIISCSIISAALRFKRNFEEPLVDRASIFEYWNDLYELSRLKELFQKDSSKFDFEKFVVLSETFFQLAAPLRHWRVAHRTRRRLIFFNSTI